MITGDAQTEQNMLRWKQKADALNASNVLSNTQFQQTKGRELDAQRLGKKSSLKKSMLEIQKSLADDPLALSGPDAQIRRAQREAKLKAAQAEYDSEFSADAEADYEKRKFIQATEPWSPWGKKSWES
jgi:hypothetical protein